MKRDNWKVKRDNCVYTQRKRQSVSVSCCDSGQTNVVNTEGSSTHLPKDFTTTVCVLQQGVVILLDCSLHDEKVCSSPVCH